MVGSRLASACSLDFGLRVTKRPQALNQRPFNPEPLAPQTLILFLPIRIFVVRWSKSGLKYSGLFVCSRDRTKEHLCRGLHARKLPSSKNSLRRRGGVHGMYKLRGYGAPRPYRSLITTT